MHLTPRVRVYVCMCLVSRYEKQFSSSRDEEQKEREKRERERDRVEDETVSWNKYRIYRVAAGPEWEEARSVGKPDAKEGASRRELRAEGGWRNVGEEVDDDDGFRSLLDRVWITSSSGPDWKWKPPNGGNDIKPVTPLKFPPPSTDLLLLSFDLSFPSFLPLFSGRLARFELPASSWTKLCVTALIHWKEGSGWTMDRVKLSECIVEQSVR